MGAQAAAAGGGGAARGLAQPGSGAGRAEPPLTPLCSLRRRAGWRWFDFISVVMPWGSPYSPRLRLAGLATEPVGVLVS